MILVTGGTGLVGSHLLYFLLQEGYAVRATYRAHSRRDVVKRVFAYYTDAVAQLYEKIDWVVADMNDIPALDTAFRGVEYVYHCAVLISFNEKDYRELKKVNIEGTANIVNLCLHHKVKKICHLSSIAALGKELNNGIVTEKTDWNPDEKNDVYAISKYGGETEVWRGTQEGLSAVILQPGVIIGGGRWNSFMGAFIKMVQKGMSFYPTGSTGIVGVEDVCKAMLLTMNSATNNTSYILVSDNVPFKILIETVAHSLQTKAPTRTIKKRGLKIMSAIDAVATVFGKKRTLTPGTVQALCTTTRYDGTKIGNELDLEYAPFQSVIKKVVMQYKKDH